MWLRLGRPPSSSSASADLVDTDRGRQDQGVVLAGGDLDSVRVADPEPALRDLRDLVAASLDLELVVDDVALGLEVVPVLDLDREAVAKRA